MSAYEGIKFLFDAQLVNITIGLLLSTFIYWYFTRNHDYWKKQGIPFEKPYPFFGSIPSILTKLRFEELEMERYKRHGRLYGTYVGNTPGLTVAEPELLRKIFVKDFQYFTIRREFSTNNYISDKMLSMVNREDWKRIRNIMSPTFSTGKIKRMLSIFKDCSKTLIKNFKTAVSEGKPINVFSIYGAYTMDVIASSAFSTKIDSHNDPENVFIKHAKMVFQQNIGFKIIFFVMFPKLAKKFGISIFASESIEFFRKATLEIIAERKRTGQNSNDFLQLLMDVATDEVNSKNEDLTEKTTNENEKGAITDCLTKNVTQKNLSMDELVAQCISFFLAGYHTTASTLSLATYLVGQDENVQNKLFKEIEEILTETNGELNYESVQKMKYLDMVVSETLRLYSPLTRLERTAEADYKLGDTGITIPKGMIVGVPVFVMHRDSHLFPDPDTFKPERFSSEEKEKQVPYSYMPFGVGPRNCIAMRFALLEVKVCLVYVFSAFQVNKFPQIKIPLEFSKSAGLLQPTSVMLNLEPRSQFPLKF